MVEQACGVSSRIRANATNRPCGKRVARPTTISTAVRMAQMWGELSCSGAASATFTTGFRFSDPNNGRS